MSDSCISANHQGSIGLYANYTVAQGSTNTDQHAVHRIQAGVK